MFVPVEPFVAVLLITCVVGVVDDFVPSGVTVKKYNSVGFYLKKMYMFECQKIAF